MSNLIYDIGMHDGEDSEFYLRKGFKVVAVEADSELCRVAAERFRAFVASGQLTIVNRAIAPNRGPLTFYRTSISGWGTVVPEWKADMERRGVTFDPVAVEGITLADLLNEYGHAFYAKLDIEGMDRRALESLAQSPVRPSYVSMETTFARAPDFAALEADLKNLRRLGYDRFKIVDQSTLSRQAPLPRASSGRYVPFRFAEGPSGLFGEETAGEWRSAEAALAEFRRIMRTKWLQMRLYRRPRLYRYFCTIMTRLTGKNPNLGWYDIHARHSSVE